MKVLTVFFSILVFVRTVSYAIYEINKGKNKKGGVAIIIIAFISIILPNIFIWIK